MLSSENLPASICFFPVPWFVWRNHRRWKRPPGRLPTSAKGESSRIAIWTSGSRTSKNGSDGGRCRNVTVVAVEHVGSGSCHGGGWWPVLLGGGFFLGGREKRGYSKKKGAWLKIGKYHFLSFGVKLMEINSNLFSRWVEQVCSVFFGGSTTGLNLKVVSIESPWNEGGWFWNS